MIDLSADMGEGAPDDEKLWPMLTSANVACGGHAGDAGSMRLAAERALRFGVRIGAHPSYPDRENFGRVSMEIGHDALRSSIIEQIEAMRAITPIAFVKAHGALYNDAHRDRALARVLIEAVTASDRSLSIVCPAVSEMAGAAADEGVHVIREAFADRRYEGDGSLTSRKIAGSLLTIDEAVAQARLLAAEGSVIARDGARVPIAFDTICIHSDMDQAVERLRAVRAALTSD